ncbi:MAG: DUF3524 domain-containing protein [Desulforhopalus sp.]|nr:DUF3524 domain-containing protein [Desulforhopalus sp.]
MKRVLILEPYFGGSHAAWLEGLCRHLAADFTLLTLPPRKWKLRMQLAAPLLVEELRRLPRKERCFDLLLCTSLLDAAVLRALLVNLPGWRTATPILLYFHENQFVYPERYTDPGRQFFCGINWHSALAADSIAFNSAYNAATFFQGCREFFQTIGEKSLLELVDRVEAKSRVLYPGIDFREIDQIPWRATTEVPVIVWNHRWEHDKNPQAFVAALFALAAAKRDFRLIILGQDFPDKGKDCFAEIERHFAAKIIHCGFAASARQYRLLLNQGDIVISTARHEFFGMAVIEAVRAGCLPLLPDRLAYPELFPAEYLYGEEHPGRILAETIGAYRRPIRSTSRSLTERFAWDNLAGEYGDWLGVTPYCQENMLG